MGRREQLEKVSQAPLKDTIFDASRKSRPPSPSQPNRDPPELRSHRGPHPARGILSKATLVSSKGTRQSAMGGDKQDGTRQVPRKGKREWPTVVL